MRLRNVKGLPKPISCMAGRPEMMRYTLMHSTKATATMPHSRNTRWITFSRALRAPVFFERIVGSFLVRNGKCPWPGIRVRGGFPGWLLGHGHRTGVFDEVGSGGRGGEVKESLGSGGESNAFLGHQHEGALDLVAAIQDGGFGAGHTVHGQSLDGGLAFHGGQGGIANGVGVAGNRLDDAASGGQLLIQLAGVLGAGDGLEAVPGAAAGKKDG